MAIFKIQEENKCIWGIWKLEETEKVLFDVFDISLTEHHFSKLLTERKRKEYLASRLLVQELLKSWDETFYGIQKDINGKPCLLKHSYELSISHAQEYVVAILHRQQAVGIDIERPHPKLERIIPRLFTEKEQSLAPNLDQKCMLWCAKEALYKWYSRRALDFKADLEIVCENDVFFGLIKKEKKVSKLPLKITQVADYQLVYCYESA